MNGSERSAAPVPLYFPARDPSAAGRAAPDAAAVLARRPELLADKSAVLDLAYEEYCARAEAGAAPEAEAFCARFPAYRSSLRRLLAAHQFLALNSSLLGAAPPPRWPEPGETWGGFTLVRELGRGAFARVYLATEASTGGRAVALKVSLEGGAEAHTLGRLRHPNVVPIFSAFTDPESGLTAVCMPFLGAATLTDVLDRAYPAAGSAPPRQARVFLDAGRAAARPADPPLDAGKPDRRLERGSYEDGVALVGLEMAEALAFLHGRSVYHLDLKPSNVLLDGGGRPVLLDFNLSADSRNAVSRPGGTLPYAAPEQVEGLVAEAPAAGPADGRADLFSLGVILYELLTGEPPFGRLPVMPLREAAPLLLARQRAGCKPVRAANPRVSRPLATLVERCLAFDRAARPASAAEVAKSLQQLFTRQRLARYARRGAAVLLAGALLVTGLAAAFRPADPAELGRAAFGKGEFAEAERLFGEALNQHPGDPRTLWARALSRLRLSQEISPKEARSHLTLALEELLKIDRTKFHKPETLVCIGYALTRCGSQHEAILHYNEAEASGFQEASLYSDRAYCYLALGKLENAEADIATALKRDNSLWAAYHNRVFLSCLRWNHDHDVRGAALGLDAAATAIAGGLESAELFYDASHLAVAADKPTVAVDYLEGALQRGKPVNLIQSDVTLSVPLKNDPRFQALLQQKYPAVDLPAGSSRLVLPVAKLLD